MSASPPPSNNGHLPQPADATPLSPTSTKLDPNNRRASFNFLRRQKSNEAGSKSGMNYSKKKGYQHPPQQPVPRVPPQLPTPAPLPTMDSFGGENARHYNNMHYGNQGAQGFDPASPPHGSASSPLYGVPMPPMPSGATQVQGGSFVDPYARTESMTHRGRYSYASSAISATGINSPRRVRRRKDPTPFK
jgi:hypothetical protein